ncbi:MAG: hypothetical protein Q6373_020820 [Candidatus Sigynarchaeota archaeon]
MLLAYPPNWVDWTRNSLYVAFVVILIVGSSILLVKARNKEHEAARKILQGYAMFGFCFACTRIFFLLSSYELFLNYPAEETFLNTIWVVSAYAITMASIVFVFRVVEHYILNHKPVFMIIALISFCIDIIALILILLKIDIGPMPPNKIALWVQTIIAPVLGIAILVLYIIVIKSSAGDIRRKATITFIGVVLILVSMLLDISLFEVPEAFIPLRDITKPCCAIAGVLLVFYSIK